MRGQGQNQPWLPLLPGHWGPRHSHQQPPFSATPCPGNHHGNRCPSRLCTCPPPPPLPHPCTCPHLLPHPTPIPAPHLLSHPTPAPMPHLIPFTLLPSDLPPHARLPTSPDKGELCRVWGQQQRKQQATPHQLPSREAGAKEREHKQRGGRRRLGRAASQHPTLA